MTTFPTEFPMERGMRLRGLAMTRIEIFADAAFAFAVTLLVISVGDVPRSFDEMVTALRSIPVFLFASAQVFLFWFAHRNWSRVYGLDDRPAVLLTLLLVVSLLVMVFPLRVMYAFGASNMTNGWVPEPFALDPALWTDQIRVMFIMLGASWAGLSGVVVTMFAYTLRHRDRLDLNDAELNNANRFIWVFSMLGLSGLSSIVIATTVPDDWVTLAGNQYFLLLLLVLVKRFKRIPWARPAKKAASEPTE